MTHKSKTGDVSSKSGKVTAQNIVTGIDIQGEASDAVLKAALEAIQQMQTGGVSGAQGVEVKGDIISGVRFRHFDPAEPTRESFVAELKALREELATAATEPNTPDEVQGAVEALDETIAETGKEKPLTKRVINRLRETVEFISDAGKALDAAHKAGPLIVKAIPIAIGLYQAAQTLF